ncbi:MAG: VanZ family protein [Chloroflexota bacterium]
MHWFLHTVPWFLPGLIVTAVAALAGARPMARALGIHPVIAALLITSVGLIVSATLTPLRDVLEDGAVSSGTCDMSRLGWAPLSMYLRPTGALLNVVLFVPLGVALGLLPRGKGWTRVAIVAGVASPFVVEGTQLLVRALGRGCEAADVVDNLTGVLLGILFGRLVAAFVARGTDGRGPA